MNVLLQWAEGNEAFLIATAVLSVVTFCGTLLLVPVLLARMRADYFVGERPRGRDGSNLHPVVRVVARVVKNLLGVVLVLMGAIMLVLPGQGILTILLGIAMLDFPGKRRIEKRIARRARVRRSIDWIRRRAQRPPLIFEGDETPTDSSR